ncbi:MAG: hypothetical protein ACE5G0_22095 [Rhodothermales bacterium]
MMQPKALDENPPLADGPGDALPSRIATATPDLLFAAAYLITWIAPYTLGRRVVAYLMLVMLLEFLIVHSSGFMGSVVFNKPLATQTKITSLLGLALFYAIFALAFSVAFRAWWPLWTILLLTLNRMLIVFAGDVPEGHERAFIKRGWAVSALLYLVFAFITTLLPMPILGISREVVEAQALPGSGLWIDEPHRVLAFGFLYFLALGLSELFSHRWLPDQTNA